MKKKLNKNLIIPILTIAFLLFISISLNAQGHWQQKGNDIAGKMFKDRLGDITRMSNAYTIAVSAPGHNTIKDNVKVIKWNTGVINAGQVSVYKWNKNKWVQKGADILSKYTKTAKINYITGNYLYGISISMPDANTLSVGNPRYYGISEDSGIALVYHWVDSNSLRHVGK